MADAFLAEIRVFGFNFAPTGWAHCNGQLLPLSQNTALFSLLGTMYGGDGRSTFALPDLQSRAPVHPGQGPGLSPYQEAQMEGVETVTLLQSETPVHTHRLQARDNSGDLQAPAPGRALAASVGGSIYQDGVASNLANKAQQSLSVVGSNLPHNNWPPVLALNFCIALQGIFPQRP
jgi:microcystin-dependent protein